MNDLFLVAGDLVIKDNAKLLHVAGLEYLHEFHGKLEVSRTLARTVNASVNVSMTDLDPIADFPSNTREPGNAPRSDEFVRHRTSISESLVATINLGALAHVIR